MFLSFSSELILLSLFHSRKELAAYSRYVMLNVALFSFFLFHYIYLFISIILFFFSAQVFGSCDGSERTVSYTVAYNNYVMSSTCWPAVFAWTVKIPPSFLIFHFIHITLTSKCHLILYLKLKIISKQNNHNCIPKYCLWLGVGDADIRTKLSHFLTLQTKKYESQDHVTVRLCIVDCIFSYTATFWDVWKD